jgi:hypothetical protein
LPARNRSAAEVFFQYAKRRVWASIIRVPGKGVTGMEEVKLWWLVLLVALLGGVGMALGG